MDNKISDLKNIYEQIDLPEDLDVVIEKSIERGKIKMRSERIKRKWATSLSAGVAMFLLFTISINTIPAIADSMNSIPGVGKIVQVLQFSKGNASGGAITDGSDVNFITLQKDKNSENIIINFSDDTSAPHYSVDYEEYPSTMTFTISGARRLSAEKDFAALKEGNLIADVYRLITLDDSMVRFKVVFKYPVEFKMTEYMQPSQLVVNLTSDKQVSQGPVYSVRTTSYPYGESLGMIEEQLMNIDTKRVIKDQQGSFLVETGYFDSEEEANASLEELSETYGSNIKFVIEKRNGSDIPMAIFE